MSATVWTQQNPGTIWADAELTALITTPSDCEHGGKPKRASRCTSLVTGYWIHVYYDCGCEAWAWDERPVEDGCDDSPY